LEEKEYISCDDMVLYFYDGKLLKDNTDVSCFSKPIACYHIPENDEFTPLQSPAFNNFLESLINLSSSVQFDISLESNANNIQNTNGNIFSQQISTMRQMGFNDDELINISLVVSNGDIERAVNYYLTVSNI
jgi:hypothetical protein